MWVRGFCLLLLLTSCSDQILVVDSYYIGSHTLASEVIGTPDPRKYCATSGQLLNVYWKLPYEYAEADNLSIRLTLRFCNREEHCENVALSCFRGRYTYYLLDDDYWDSGGILTYKVEIYSGDCLIDLLCHQIWTEMIVFDEYEQEDQILDNYPWKI